jgi:DNA-binding SARP family transcriptional activator
MRYGLLGTIEVWAGGRPVPIQRARPRAVLGVLLLEAGRPVSVAALIEALWGGASPRSARAQVHADICEVRRALRIADGGSLHTTPGGYELRAGPEEIDHGRFGQLVGHARGTADPHEAAVLLRAAVGLWRGPALAGASAAYVGAVRARLDDERHAAYEFLAEVELGLGRHADIVDELASVAAGAPLRERLHGQLMLALYRAGRPAEALAVARRLRRRLAEEHGIDPGRDLTTLEHRILTGDPGLDRPPPSGAPAVPAKLGGLGGPAGLGGLGGFAGDNDGSALRHGLRVASSASLKASVSEWEHGSRPIDEDHATMLRAVLGLTDAEPSAVSGAAVSDGHAELIERVESAHAVGRTMVGLMTSQTELLRTMDRQVGAAGLIDQLAAHLDRLQDTLGFTVLPASRRPVARALAEAASMAAWQALDVGAAGRAWRHYELAKAAAREADDVLCLVHAMGEQAFVLADAGRPALAVELVAAARRTGGGRTSARLNAWLAGAEAELLAHAGQHDGARRALDRAVGSLPTGSARDDDLPGVFLDGAHLRRWRGHTLALTGDAASIGELRGALSTMDPTFVRARAGVHCDLAQAHAVRGEHAERDEHLREARLLADRTGSVRHRRRIRLLSRR